MFMATIAELQHRYKMLRREFSIICVLPLTTSPLAVILECQPLAHCQRRTFRDMLHNSISCVNVAISHQARRASAMSVAFKVAPPKLAYRPPR